MSAPVSFSRWLCGYSRSGVVLATGPRRPEAHVVARLDDYRPVLALLLGRLRDEPELHPEPLHPERDDLDLAELDRPQRLQQRGLAGAGRVLVQLRPRAQVLDLGVQPPAALVEQVQGQELPPRVAADG